MGIKDTPDWKWHMWHTDPKTGVRKYVCFFRTEDGALSWKRKQANPSEYRITNYGPADFAKMAPRTPVRANRPPSSGPAAEAMAEARRKADQKYREEQRLRIEKQRKAEEQKRANDKEMADIREDAASLIRQHKHDEADDLRRGVNR